MIAEIISIGTELLLGQIVNTNAAYIAQRLGELGINTYHQSVVGDNPRKITEVIQIAEGRSDLLIFIGGLGPTQDDISKQTVGAHIDEPLILSDETLKGIRHYFGGQGREMTDNNERQAYYFQNGRFFKNTNGQAIGTFIEKNNKSYLLVPGPPVEMKKMFTDEIMPFLQTKVSQDRQFILSKTLRFFGIGESSLVTRLQDMIEYQTNPTIAAYAGNHEVSLRITANGESEAECQALLQKMTNDILALVGDYLYAEGNESSLVKVVAQLLTEKKLKISAAESLTGGLFQANLVTVPHSSKVFSGGIVAYDEATKRDVLGVPEAILKEEGMVSEACAISMAEKSRELFQSDIAISFTGVAGPEELEGNPVGTVWIGISPKGQPSFARKFRFMSDREGNRNRSVKQGLDLLRRFLLEK